MTDLQTLQTELLAAITAANDETTLEAVRIAALGKSGSVSALLKTLGAMTPDERKEQGPRINGLKEAVNAALAARKDALKNAALEARLNTETIDVTLPVREPPAEIGRIHPISQVVDELTAIFADMGFAVAEGPDIETDDLNFTKLNFPEGHPAREMHDTFYFNPKPDGSRLLLRTHTSPVQIRALLTRPLPVYVVSPGKCFRTDPLDATHSPVFHQIECLAVDEGLTMADLRGAVQVFVDAMFGEGLRTRLRPDYFPFTEPSADVSMECHVCRGASTRPGGAPCRVCRSQGWIELAGCGMVNPRVLVACGVDPEKYSGFAFGFGIERMLMFRHNVEDMRDMVEGDVRFTRPFGMEI